MLVARLRSWLSALASCRRFEDGMNAELRFHLEVYRADLERGGMPRAEAVRRARLEFGGMDGVREDCRAARGLRPSPNVSRRGRRDGAGVAGGVSPAVTSGGADLAG